MGEHLLLMPSEQLLQIAEVRHYDFQIFVQSTYSTQGLWVSVISSCT